MRDTGDCPSLPSHLIRRHGVSATRLQTLLLSGFGGMALLLAPSGIYAVLSFTVPQRTQEIGARVAMGAGPGDMLRMVLAQGGRLFILGVAIGLIAALALSRLLEHLLFGLSSTDLPSYAAVLVLLAAVTLFACWLPARRAMRLEPTIALRYE